MPPPSEGESYPSARLTPASASRPGIRRMSTDAAERCAICLMPIVDRTRGACQHEFCFRCIGVWANQCRRCPLCNADMGEHFTHDLDSNPPTKFFLPPLANPGSIRSRVAPRPSTSPPVPIPMSPTAAAALDTALERRRQVYAHGVFAKHIAANEWTGYSRTLTPQEVDPDRALQFLERELQIWTSDPKPLAAHIVHLLTAVDVRSDAAVLLLEPLVGDTSAQHLAHELYSFLRSSRGLEEWDDIVQYDEAAGAPVPEVLRSQKRGRSLSRGRSRSVSSYSSYSRSPSRSRSRSWSRGQSALRDPTRLDSFRPTDGGRRWDQADSWVDPEYAAELKRRKRRRGQGGKGAQMETERQGQQGGRPRDPQHHRQPESARGRELLDGPAASGGATFGRAAAGAGLVIRGAAERRASLLERLAKAKEREEGGQVEVSAAGESGKDSEANGGHGANTNGEEGGKSDRAQELRERLMAERKRRLLREQLMARKRAKGAIDEAAEERINSGQTRPAGQVAEEGSSR